MKKKIFLVFFLVFGIVFFVFRVNKNNNEFIMIDLSLYNEKEIIEKGNELDVSVVIEHQENNDLKEGSFISQSIKKGEKYKTGDTIIIVFSKKEEEIDYEKYNVNELGVVPIMMYHGIHNLKNDDTPHIGGNVDISGYNRTKEAFINDLEMYYKKGYRMIRLNDYINGLIDVKLGYSPIVLTFDDGNRNNINILGVDDNNELIIDPNSAVGILENFKKKYPDFNVTATFFVNEGLFHQPKYNEKIIKWLVENNYDIGNHTLGHVDLSSTSSLETMRSIGYIYRKLNNIIGDKYVPIVALPFGKPNNFDHSNFEYIIKGEFEGYKYQTKGILRVGWEPNLSPFHKNFNPHFIKRVRAYDNNGLDFDIESTFKLLEPTRYISDGKKNQITIRDDSNIKEGINKKITKY